MSEDRKNDSTTVWHVTTDERSLLEEEITVREVEQEAEWIKVMLTAKLNSHTTPLSVISRSEKGLTSEVAIKFKAYRKT